MRLDEVVVEVTDVEAAAAFYQRLGLPERRRGRWQRGPWVELGGEHGTRLMLIRGDGGVRLSFAVDDLDAAVAALEAAGGTAGAPVEVGDGTWVEGRDPWGTPLGFWSAP